MLASSLPAIRNLGLMSGIDILAATLADLIMLAAVATVGEHLRAAPRTLARSDDAPPV